MTGHWIATSKTLGRAAFNTRRSHSPERPMSRRDTGGSGCEFCQTRAALGMAPMQTCPHRYALCPACAHDKHLRAHPTPQHQSPCPPGQPAAPTCREEGKHLGWPEKWTDQGATCGYDVQVLLAEATGERVEMNTYTVTTRSGGTHLYYAHPQGGSQLRNTQGELGWLVDTRAWGGYVVGAGSIVDNVEYQATWAAAVVRLPGWLANRLTPKPLPPQRPVTVRLGTGRRAAYLDSAINGSLTAISTAPDGTLNRTLYGASVALGQLIAGGALNPTDTETLLLNAAVAAGHPSGPAQRTIRSGFRAGTNRPRSVAA